MQKLDSDVIYFLEKQNYVNVLTIDKEGSINCAAKSIAGIDAATSIIYIVDLYEGRTCENLLNNSHMTISAINEEHFEGWQIKGHGKELLVDENNELLEKFDKHISKRITDRIVGNLKKKKQSLEHYEAHLPKPKYIIKFKVEEVWDISGKK